MVRRTGKNVRMGSVLDWFRKKKPTTLPALPQGGVIYVSPSGEAKTQLPSLRPGTPGKRGTIKEQLLSIFEPFGPKAESRLPAIIKSMDILPVSFQEKPREELTAAEESGQMTLWQELFEEEAEEAPGSIFDVLVKEKESEVPEPHITPIFGEEPVYRKALHEDWPTGEPPIYLVTKWKVPTAFEVAHWIKTSQNKWDLPAMFEYTLINTDGNDWKQMVEDSAHTGDRAELEIEQVARAQSAYEDLAEFLDIPQRVIDVYFDDVANEEMAHERAWRFEREVLGPYLDNVSKALEALRPIELRGWYEISTSDDYSWWLKYVEVKHRSLS